MKMHLRFFLVAITAMVPLVRLMAIPTNIGGFLNSAGNQNHLPIEEWFRDEKHWHAGSELPGPWSGSAGDTSRMTLENPGAIFGISAHNVTVVKDATGNVKEVIASYDEATSKRTHAALVTALQKNIGVFIGGSSKKQADGSQAFAGAGLIVTLTANGGVTARIVRS